MKSCQKMSEGAIKQNLLRNKRNLKKILERKGKRCMDNPEFDYHGIPLSIA